MPSAVCGSNERTSMITISTSAARMAATNNTSATHRSAFTAGTAVTEGGWGTASVEEAGTHCVGFGGTSTTRPPRGSSAGTGSPGYGPSTVPTGAGGGSGGTKVSGSAGPATAGAAIATGATSTTSGETPRTPTAPPPAKAGGGAPGVKLGLRVSSRTPEMMRRGPGTAGAAPGAGETVSGVAAGKAASTRLSPSSPRWMAYMLIRLPA